MGLYPKGEYPPNYSAPCGDLHKISGTVCIIDNKHPGRRHWGPDPEGNYREWGQVGVDKNPTEK